MCYIIKQVLIERVFTLKNEILRLLEQDSRYTIDQLATMLAADREAVAATIKELEDEKIILGYKTLINWERTDRDNISAIITIKITPQRGDGYDKIAERIYKYPQVRGVTLMSGSFDLLVSVEGKTLKDVAMFVSEKLAPMEGVVSTNTHFTLKTYKKEDVIFTGDDVDDREVITI